LRLMLFGGLLLGLMSFKRAYKQPASR